MFTLDAAYQAIDDVNTQDPNQLMLNGAPQPAELVYGQRMTDRLMAFVEAPSNALAIACRAQHIERWIIPRTNYPMDRQGYLRWRKALGEHHAERTQGLLAELGAEAELIEKVGKLLRKEALKRNPEAQTLEDVACLVFIEHYLVDFSKKHSEEKLISIIQKTWRKMSEAGHSAALNLPISDEVAPLLTKALGDN